MDLLTIFAVYGLKHIYDVEPVFFVYRTGMPSIMGSFNSKEKAQNFCSYFYSLDKSVYNYRPIISSDQEIFKIIKLNHIQDSLNIDIKKIYAQYSEDTHIVKLKDNALEEIKINFLEKYLSTVIQKKLVSKSIEKDMMKISDKKINH